ncbi:MAG: hypothetical protein M1834_006268 [Cirrosporium novae-zelandiae]|nr:MAG: hypothetical protein M1834_006268 [Cirrosporium novae-zelandiae]
MESSFHRFRVSRPSDPPQSLPSSPSALARTRQEIAFDKAPSACHRCRRLKKKCSRTTPECTLCVAAGVRCSFPDNFISPKRAKQLEERIAWLSKCVNDALPVDCPSVESIDTGTNINLSSSTSIGYPERNLDTTPSGSSYRHNSTGEQISTSGSCLNFDDDQSLQHQEGSGPAHHTPRPPIHRMAPESAGRQFVNVYFKHVHRAYPFINRAKVLEDIEAVGDLTEDGIGTISTKLYMIMAIGCTTLQRAGRLPDGIFAKFRISYADIVQECLHKNNIESMETLVLLGLYSLFDPSGLSPWTITGILSRQVIALGLSRKSLQSNRSSPHELELQNRLFWSIYVFDRMISVSLGLPVGMNDEKANIPLPSITMEEYTSPERTTLAVTLQVNRHIISLRQIEENILKKVHLPNQNMISSLSQADKFSIIQDLRSQVEDWYSHGCLLVPLEIDRDRIPFHNTVPWLNVRYHNLLILLYSPSHFHSDISLAQLMDLQRSAQSYVQSSAVLLQKHQLPLNWITLYRLIPICAVLLYCFVRLKGVRRPFDSKEEVEICADILDAFPERWQIAKRSAQVFRLLAVATSPENVVASIDSIINHGNLVSDSTAGVGDSGRVSLSSVETEVMSLIREVLGEASIYNSIDGTADILGEGTDLQLFDRCRSALQASNDTDDRAWFADSTWSMEFL